MLKQFLKTSWRSLVRNRSYGIINIAGLTLGLAAVILIALWVHDERSFNKYYENYDRISMVLSQQTVNGIVSTNSSQPIPLSAAIRNALGSSAEHVSLISTGEYNLNAGEKMISGKGIFLEPGGTDMFSTKIVMGSSARSLSDPSSILISQRLAIALFGHQNPVNQIVRITGQFDLKVAGVYKNFPDNVKYNDVDFMAPWAFYQSSWDWVKQQKENWDYNLFNICIQFAPSANQIAAARQIEGILASHIKANTNLGSTTRLALYPMNRWHLYDEFNERGESIGGQLKYVKLFAGIGLSILLLACINFMNLSTARSVQRAREVGVRKAIGSDRLQLIAQFFCESMVASLAAFLLAMAVVAFTLPFFNHLSGKHIHFPWLNPWFWLTGLGICLITGIIAGSYPALYLSSFKPIKVLKGIFKTTRTAAIPRKVLVVLQFTVSIFLMIATAVVYMQIQYAKHRPTGYNQHGLLSIHMTTPEIYNSYNVIKNELLASGYVTGVAVSQCPVTQIWAGDNGFDWKGKAPGTPNGFPVVAASTDFGEVLGWNFVAGRGFSAAFPSDSSGLVLSESAVDYMHLDNPVGEIIKWHDKNYTVLGVVKDIMMDYPYSKVPPVIFPLLREPGNFMILRVKPEKSMHEAIAAVGKIMKVYNSSAPFTYSFVDEDYAANFNYEERIGHIATVFAVLALAISLLGLFGMASFTVEQKTKEVGIRKVLGASVLLIWRLLSRELILLVFVAVCAAIPVSYLAMEKWLINYEYHISIPVWIFIIAAFISIAVALLTISVQTVKAARVNPVESLKMD